MTVTTMSPASDVVPRTRQASTLKCVLLTGAFVVFGFTAASVLLSPAPTPSNVTTAYVEASLSGDWKAAWALTCGARRAAGGAQMLAGTVERLNERYGADPAADIAIDRISPIPEYGRAAAFVSANLTFDQPNQEGRTAEAYLLLVEDDGELQVCTSSFSDG